jgi:hypothetical protein
MYTDWNSRTTGQQLRVILLQLAKGQDDQAASEAAVTPYWAAAPVSVVGHRAAAVALRAEADRLLATVWQS